MDAGYTGEGKGAEWVEKVLWGGRGTDRAPSTEAGSRLGNEEVGFKRVSN